MQSILIRLADTVSFIEILLWLWLKELLQCCIIFDYCKECARFPGKCSGGQHSFEEMPDSCRALRRQEWGDVQREGVEYAGESARGLLCLLWYVFPKPQSAPSMKNNMYTKIFILAG